MTNLSQFLTKRQIIFIDTAPFIYHFENSEKYSPLTKVLFSALDKNSVRAITSVITRTEIITKPYQVGNQELVEKYIHYFRSGKNLVVHPINENIAIVAGELRGKYPSIKSIDALQLGTALFLEAKVFLTNDFQLEQVKEIEVVVLSKITV
ncbi:MAG: PIN domain-containing protein [Melioribacteraceae bacterium]